MERVTQADQARGLTYNWNVAYRMFKHNASYTHLFLINNDMEFPSGSFTEMAKVCPRFNSLRWSRATVPHRC